MNAKPILSLLFMGALLSAHAEEKEFHPIVDENLTWSYCDVIKREADRYDMIYSQYYFRGDTTINGRAYKKLYQTNCSNQTTYVAAMREEGEKVYAVHQQLYTPEKEQVVYNFDLKEGETMPNLYTGAEVVDVLQKVDLIQTEDGSRRSFEFAGDTWVEGIGSIERPLHLPLSPVPLYDLGIRLNYQKRGSEFTYKTDGFWLNENDCKSSRVETPQAKPAITATQPERDVLCVVTTKGGTFDLKIYDLSGQVLQSLQGKSGEHIDISLLPAGIYLLHVNGKAVQKTIKQ